jgi:large conductance mechanosensitive channel
MLKEFRDFAMRGNVLDMVVGVIVGGAFGKISTSLVNDVIMPPIGLALGRVDFNNFYLNLSRHHYDNLADAKKAGAAVVAYGAFINNIIDFLIVAFAVFMLVRQVNKLYRPKEAQPSAPSAKECPYCFSGLT